MNFTQLSLSVESNTLVFSPYDRGLKGAFVWRLSNAYVNAQRIVASTVTNDSASDRYNFQVAAPRVKAVEPGCCPTGSDLLGTDLVSVDLRFLASTEPAKRITQIETAIALLNSMKSMVSTRDKIYT